MRTRRMLPVAAALTLMGGSAHAGAAVVDAARQGDLAALKTLVTKRADVNAAEGDGSTALLWAAYRGDIEMVRALIRARADVNAKNHFGMTPLLQAARIGNPVMVADLLQAGADPGTTRQGETPLMAASGAGSVETVKLLLEHGADVNAAEEAKSQTALMWAAEEGHLAVVKALLAAGADPNIVSRPIVLVNEALGDQGRNWSDYSRGGFTALMYSAREGHLDVAAALADGGAKFDIRTPDQLTALLLAVINDSLDLAAMLVDKGASPDDGSLYELVQLRNLRTNSTADDASRPRPDRENQITPLQLAVKLLEKGADPHRPAEHAIHTDGTAGAGASGVGSRSRPNSYSAALQVRDVEMLRVFLESKAVDPNVLPPGAVTPLVDIFSSPPRGVPGGAPAAPFRYPGIRSSDAACALLLDAGADPNAATASGDTALHKAAQGGDLKAIQLLADRGARLDAQNKAGLTPLDLAMGKRPPPDPKAPPPSPFAFFLDGPQPEAVVLLRQLTGLPALPPDQLPKRARPPAF